MYFGMPIQKEFQFSLDVSKIKSLCQNLSKTNVFHKMGISPQKMSSRQNLNESFTGIWTKGEQEDLKFNEEDQFGERCDKYYRQIAHKMVKFKDQLRSGFQMELNINSQLDLMLFLQQKWELSETLQKKVKTMDEEKNYLANENKNIQKERKNLNRKNKELVFENTRLKSQNELLLEEKNYFMNHKNCFDKLQVLGEQSILNKSSSINIGKTKANISVIEILTDRNKVELTGRLCWKPITTLWN
jgi:exonuclease VII large subunit